MEHGHWIVYKDKDLICSQCHTHIKNREDEIKLIDTQFFGVRYCEWCGARMDEKPERR